MAEGGTRNPPRNRKGGSGHSPPKGARAEDLSRQPHARFYGRVLETDTLVHRASARPNHILNRIQQEVIEYLQGEEA